MSSPSASGRSNGRRLVSANAATMKMKDASASGNTFHVNNDRDCLAITSVRVTFPASSSTVAVLLLAGNVTLTDVIAKQSRSLFTWNVFPLALASFIFIVAAFAETNRLPFDLPEAEGELIAGYHTEYSAMKFSMFYIAEYSNMVTASALMTTLFFGGWDIPVTTWDNTAPWSVLKTLLTLSSFTLKTLF